MKHLCVNCLKHTMAVIANDTVAAQIVVMIALM